MNIRLKRGEGFPSSHTGSNELHNTFLSRIYDQFIHWYKPRLIDLDLLEIPHSSDDKDYITFEVYYLHGDKFYSEYQNTLVTKKVNLSAEDLGILFADKVLKRIAKRHKLVPSTLLQNANT
jgi:hypothetical protein